MHELGHTLGLAHGGADDVNRKPNYLGVDEINQLHETTGRLMMIIPLTPLFIGFSPRR